jgi:hypothetical protein
VPLTATTEVSVGIKAPCPPVKRRMGRMVDKLRNPPDAPSAPGEDIGVACHCSPVQALESALEPI